MRSLIVVFILLSFFGAAATIDVRLEVKEITLDISTGGTIPYLVYTESPTTVKKSDLLIWELGDQINLKVVNTTTNNHGFEVPGLISFGAILPGDSAEQSFTLNAVGVYRYFDPENNPYYAHAGLAGIIHVKDPSDITPYFYWDIREHEVGWNTSILGGGSPTLTSYNPSEFTLNGSFNPDINGDPIARVTGSVGNEFKIVIVNNGLSIHSLHFHGYHCDIINDSRNPAWTGRSKDTFPIYPEEHLVLACVPDKPGEYPVHDHNLVAVTGGGLYPNGMFITLLIGP